MEDDHRAHTRGGIPRLSRLPMPRASNDNLKTLRSQPSRDNIQRDVHLKAPDFTRYGSLRSPVKSPLGETNLNGVKGRFGWPDRDSRERNRSPVREALKQASTVLETTPPGLKVVNPVVDGDENGSRKHEVDKQTTISGLTVRTEKRKPRPSLTERTADTLAQLSPSPAPTRVRGLSTVANDSRMGPPCRPASVMKTSRPGTSHSSRPSSPTKLPPKALALSSSTSYRGTPPVPSTPSFDLIYTPPRVHMRDSETRNPRQLREPRRSTSTAIPESSHAASHQNVASKPVAQTMRAKTPHASTAPRAQLSLTNLFQDRVRKEPQVSKEEPRVMDHTLRSVKARSRAENAITFSKPTSANPARSMTPAVPYKPVRSENGRQESPDKAAKSSTAFREQIARAKAESQKSRRDESVRQHTELPDGQSAKAIDDLAVFGANNGLMSKRIQAASTTGSLNLSVMRLTDIPDEVMHMYEFDESSTIVWSETVDLVKLNVADNEISILREDAFPDLPASELVEDDTASNQFGGLEMFDLHNNLLQAIPVGMRRLERLHTLNLNNNHLNTGALEIICQILNLKELYLASNELKGDLSPRIGDMESLEVLDLRSNALESLPDEIKQLVHLRILRLSGNRLSSINIDPLVDLPLIELDASKNALRGQLFNKGIASLKALKRLDVSFNKLDSVSAEDIWPLPNVQTIAVEGNRIKTLPSMTSAASLTTLTASENLLTELPIGFGELINLKNADFSRNHIRFIPGEIAQMEALTTLNLTGNPLQDRKYLTMTTAETKDDLRKRFGIDDSQLDDHDAVSTALLASRSNKSAGIDSAATAISSHSTYIYMPKGGVLDLSNQDFSGIKTDTIDLTGPVTSLKLSSASLTHLPIELLTHPSVQHTLQNLNLSHNPLHNTSYLSEPLHLPALTSLYVVSTGLISLSALTTHLSAPNLRELNISCHRLSGALPDLRAHFPSLTTLLATDNWFNSLPLASVEGLEVLDVRNNEIEYLPPAIGMLGVHSKRSQLSSGNSGVVDSTKGKLKSLEVSGNRFRVPNWRIVEKGTEAILKDLRRMVPLHELVGEWREGD